MSLKLEPHEVAFWREVYARVVGPLYDDAPAGRELPDIAEQAATLADAAVASLRSRLPAPEAATPAYTFRLLDKGEVIAEGDEVYERPGWYSTANVGKIQGECDSIPRRRRVKP